METINEDRDEPRVRTILFANNKLNMKRSDPYGFITLSLERGALPEFLKGNYTTWDAARKDVARYISEYEKEVVNAQPEKPVIPTLERKKVA